MALTETPKPVLEKVEADAAAPPETAPDVVRPPAGLCRDPRGELGGNGILLPNIVAGLDEAGKIGNLAIVTTVAFIANIFAQPVRGGAVRRDPVPASGAARHGWSVARSSRAASSSASRWPSPS